MISSRNFKDVSSVSNLVLSHVIKWFAANKLNLDKTSVMKFITRIHHIPCYILVKKIYIYMYRRYSKYKLITT